RYLVVPKPGKLYLRPIDGGEPRLIGVLEPAESPVRWSSDGQSLFLRHAEPGQPFLKVYRVQVSTGRRELWRELKPPDPVGVLMQDVSITPDGKSYAYSFQRDLADLYLMQGLK